MFGEIALYPVYYKILITQELSNCFYGKLNINVWQQAANFTNRHDNISSKPIHT